jgi:uncharacterized tellurite resistance protein B-like protein
MASRASHQGDPEFWNHRTTVAALLFKVMPIDGEIHASERLRLNRILSDEFSIDEDEVNDLVREAHARVSGASDLSELFAILKDTLSNKDKRTLISHMWEMVLADGKLHEYELLLMDRVAGLLGVDSSEVSALMKRQD